MKIYDSYIKTVDILFSRVFVSQIAYYCPLSRLTVYYSSFLVVGFDAYFHPEVIVLQLVG